MKKKSNEQLFFPIVVGALSLISIQRNIQEFYLSSILVSILGLVAVALFFVDSKKATPLFYVWIVLQIVTYQSPTFTYFTNQLPQFSLGMNFKGTESLFAVNFVPIIYFVGYRILKMYDLIGKRVNIFPIRENTTLESIDGEITEIINTNSSGKWLKVQFFLEGKTEPQFVMIKPKGQEQFSSKKSIIAFVHESGDVTKFIDWGAVKLK